MLVVQAIPYKNLKQKIKIINNIRKAKRVIIEDDYIYVEYFEKGAGEFEKYDKRQRQSLAML